MQALRRAHLCFGLIALVASLCRAAVSAAGDTALGEYLSSECAACHQTSGRLAGSIPVIAGRPADQFVALMNAYRTRQRSNDVMWTIAARLNDQEIEALAAYYESLKPPG